MSKLIENSSYQILSNTLQLFISLASGMIIARMLGPEGKGAFYLINQLVAIGAVFFSLGTGSSLLYYLKTSAFSQCQAKTFSILYIIAATVIILLLFLFGKKFIISFLDGNISFELLVFGMLLIILNILINFWSYIIMDNVKGIKTLSIISILGNVLFIVFLFVLVYWLSKGVQGALIALLASVLLRISIISWYIFKDKFTFKMIPTNSIKPVFKYGIGIFIGNLFLTGAYRIDVFFVNKMLSISDVGVYSAAVNISGLLLIVPSAVGIALFPYFSSLDQQDQIQSMCKVGRLSFIVGVLGAFFLAVIAYPFIIVIFGAKFIDAFIPCLMLLPGLVAMTLNYAYSNYLFSIGKPFTAAKIFALGLIVNILLNGTLLKTFGINGAAIFSSITYIIITGGFMWFILKSNKDLKLKDIVIPNSDDLIFIFDKVQTILKSNFK